MMTIPLDPTMTAKENSQKYFERYNKLKRTFEALSTLTVETENELAHLESIMTSIDIAASDVDLDEIRRELGEAVILNRMVQKGERTIEENVFLITIFLLMALISMLEKTTTRMKN